MIRAAALATLTVLWACTSAPAPTPAADAGSDANSHFDAGAPDSSACGGDEACPGDQYCSAGTCKPDLCQPGSPATCDGDAVKACQKNGGGWTATPCPSGHKCSAGVCAAAKPTCPPADIATDFAKAEKLSQTYKACANASGCAGKSGDADKAACFKTCILAAFPLGDACGACLGAYATCLFSTCKAQCSVDPSAKSCEGCAAAACDPALAACPM